MNINIRAKFKNESMAKEAIEEVRKSIQLNNFKLISTNTIREYIKEYYDTRLKNGLVLSTSIGSVVGALFGLSMHYVLINSLPQLSISSYGAFLFLLMGLFIGIVFSLILFFVRREKVPTISIHDVKDNQAIVVFNISSNKVESLKTILDTKQVIKYQVA